MINIASVFESLAEFKIFGIPAIYFIIFVFAIIIIILLKMKKPEKEKLKRKDIFKIVKENCKKMFEITQENLGKNRTLNRGSVVIGNIKNMINFNWYETVDKNNITNPEILQQLGINIDDKDEMKKLRRHVLGQKQKIRISKPFYAFEIYKKGIFNKIKAKFGFGLRYYFVDQELISFNPFEIIIDPVSQYVNFIDVVVFSQAGIDIVSNIAFKENLENVLEELANVLPKQTFLEIKQAESKLQFDLLQDIAKEKRKELREQIKKA